MADNILSYIDQLNPTSALIGASNMVLRGLQGAGVLPRVDGPYVPQKNNTGTRTRASAGERARESRRGSAFNNPLSLRNRYGGSGDMDAGATRVSFQFDRVAPAVLNGVPGIVDVNPQTGEMLPGTWRRGDMDAGPGKVSEMNDLSQADYVVPTVVPPVPTLPPEERSYQTELARTQQMAAANPYFQQMDLYAQGQRAMQTQEDMNKVRDLGLAINRSMYGDMTTPRTPNPLMAGLTPPGPAQPVIPMDEEGRIGQLDTAAAGVQDFMRKYAEGMKKRKGEE
jgi:hypothetical protein